MKQKIIRFLHSDLYRILRSVITLDGDKKYIVSSMSYYILLSFVPLCAVTLYFLNLFGVENHPLMSIIGQIGPNVDFSVENLFSNNISLIVSTVLSIYIASKGILNYYYYLNEKFRIEALPYAFFTTKLYASALILILTVSFSFIAAFGSYIRKVFISVVYFDWIFRLFCTFLILLFLNYFLLRRKIALRDLLPGSILSSVLFRFSSFILAYYFSTYDKKERYYGIFTDIVLLLLFIYLISYFFALGNQINYLYIEKKKSM